MNRPKVSVVIPAYNGGAFVQDAIRSCLMQDYPSQEIIAVNDASTDDTAAKVSAFPQVKLISLSENGGAAAALNRGFREAKGEYICWLSADDRFVSPLKTARQVKKMLDVDADWSYYTGRRSKTTRLYAHWFDHDPRKRLMILLFFNPINGSSLMIKKSVFESIGGFNEARRNFDADFDIWFRLTEAGFKMIPIQDEYVVNGQGPWQHSRRPEYAKACEDTRLGVIKRLESEGTLDGLVEHSRLFFMWLYATGKDQRRPTVSRVLAERIAANGGLLSWLAKRSLSR